MKEDRGTTIVSLTIADAPAVADVHRAAFRNSALTKLGRGVVVRYYVWLLSGPHDVVALGVDDASGGLVGYCLGGTFRGALSGFIRRNRAPLVLAALVRPWLLGSALVRGRTRLGVRLATRPTAQPVAPGMPTTSDDSFGIEVIATRPDREGMGIGGKLLTEMERRARAAGCAAMHLTVSPANHRALSFYEARGWRRVASGGEWAGLMRKELGGGQSAPDASR